MHATETHAAIFTKITRKVNVNVTPAHTKNSCFYCHAINSIVSAVKVRIQLEQTQKCHTTEEEYYFEMHVSMPVYVIHHQLFHIKSKHLQ